MNPFDSVQINRGDSNKNNRKNILKNRNQMCPICQPSLYLKSFNDV